jgi:hypothetical protein
MNFAKEMDLMMKAHMPTLDVRLREDAREMLWRLRTGAELSAEERKNLSTARADLDFVLREGKAA